MAKKAKIETNKKIKQKCPVCGNEAKLTLHHILPRYIFKEIKTDEREFFLNGANSYWLCRKCHDKYEGKANNLRSKLLKNLFFPKKASLPFVLQSEKRKIKNLCGFMSGKYSQNNYGYSIYEAYDYVRKAYKKPYLAFDEILEWSEMEEIIENEDYINVGQFLIEKLGVEELDRLYRKDFREFLIKRNVNVRKSFLLKNKYYIQKENKMKYDLKLLHSYIDKKLINVQLHPTLPLRIYKYSQECVFSRAWDEITLNMRGTVLDEKGNLISNPFPKFFNLEELEPLGISLPNLPYKVYDKADGSLIEVFMYNGELVVSSAGSFTSPQAIAAGKLLETKYSHLKQFINNENTYLFELIFPLNKIVLNYGNEEKLVLLAVRNTDTGSETLGALDSARELGFDVIDEIKLSLDELKEEIKRKDFINKEGFVVVYENGFRVKMKYAEYFRLHKIVCNVNEKFVWEFISKGKKINLHDIPDETFDFIKLTEKNLHDAFDAKWNEADKIYREIHLSLNQKYGYDNWDKKDFALIVVPKYKKLSGILFKLYENRFEEAKEIIWKMIEPKYEKGVSGFQSMKIGM